MGAIIFLIIIFTLLYITYKILKKQRKKLIDAGKKGGIINAMAMVIVGAFLFVTGSMIVFGTIAYRMDNNLYIPQFMHHQSKETVRTSDWRDVDKSVRAEIEMRYYVKKKLKSPASAKFAGTLAPETKVAPIQGKIREQRYAVKSYVDSQNSFGAMLRTYYVGIVEQTSEGNWIVTDFIFLQQ